MAKLKALEETEAIRENKKRIAEFKTKHRENMIASKVTQRLQ